MDATVLYGMGCEIGVAIDLDLLGALQKPAEVIPEQRRVTDVYRADVCEFMDGDEGDNVLVHQFLLGIALAETHEDLFALVDGIGGIGGVGSGFRETGGIGIKIADHLGDERLVGVRLFEGIHQAQQLGAGAGQTIGGLLLIRQIADNVLLMVHGGFHMSHIMGALFEGEGGGTCAEDTEN